MTRVSDIQRVRDYADSIRSGKAPSCETIRLAVERWYADLDNEDIYFDEGTFNTFCRFARAFKHIKGPMAGKTFEPEPWQLFIVANVLGLRRVSTGRRKYRAAEIYVPRKNGKTMYASILANWFLLMDGESGPEVYTAAVDQAQARLCYEASESILQRSVFWPMVKKYVWGLKYPAQVGIYKPLSKDTKNKDGLNISAAVCDERHAWPNTEMMDVIKTGMGARTNPMLISISTAGVDTSYPYFNDIETYEKELRGQIPLEDDHFFMLYRPDAGDEYDDETVWAKVNPNLGVSLDLTYMCSMCAEAKARGGTYLTAFKTKNLNMWVNAPDVWIPDDIVVENCAAFDRGLLEGAECWVGIDLARKTDICAVGLWFPEYKVCDWLFIIPQAKLEEQRDRVDYRRWVEQGYITVCPSAVLDEDWFIVTLLQRLDHYKVRCIAYDPWGMWNILDKFGRYSEYLTEYQQSIRYMSVPTKWFEGELRERHLNCLGNPVFRWMMSNVVVYIDPNENIKLDKKRSRNKIDGVVAIVDAIGGWLSKTAGKPTRIYTDHTLRSVGPMI